MVGAAYAFDPMRDVLPPRRVSGIYAVVLIGFGAAVAQSFGRFTFGLLLPAITKDLGISTSLGGTLATINVGAYLAGTLAVALATGRYRLLQVMKVGFVLSVAGLILSAYSPGAVTLGVAQFLSGLGGAFIWIPSPVIAADAMPPERRRFAIGLMGSGIGLGVVISGQLSGLVRGTFGDESWRLVYGIQASVGIAVAVFVFLYLGHKQEKPRKQAGVGGLAALRRMRGWIPLTAAYTIFGFMYLLVVAFLSSKLEDDNGWSSGRASLAFTLLGIAMIGGGPAFISISNHIGVKRALALAFGLWSTLAVVILPGWLVPSMLSAIGLGLLFSAMPSMMTLYVVENTSTEDYGPSFSVATLFFGIAQMASPQVGGIVADRAGSFTPVFLMSAAAGLAGIVAAALLPGAEKSAPSTG